MGAEAEDMEPMEEMDIIALEVVEDMVKEDMVVLTALPFGLMPLEGVAHMEGAAVLELKDRYLVAEDVLAKTVQMVFVLFNITYLKEYFIMNIKHIYIIL